MYANILCSLLITCVLQNDMQVSVRKRLVDQSTLVREATVDLLGRFILTQPEISQQYYDMLSERILVIIIIIFI